MGESGKSAKLSLKLNGPFVVVKKCSVNSYLVSEEGGHGKVLLVNLAGVSWFS